MGQRPKINFFRIWSCCISNSRERPMQQYGSKYFARRPLSPDPGGWGQKVKIQLFQNWSCCISNERDRQNQQHASTYTHALEPWGGVKGQSFFFLHIKLIPIEQKVKTFFLLKVVMLHIKLKGMEHRAPFKHIFCPYTHPQPPDVVKRLKHFFFSESSLSCCISN